MNFEAVLLQCEDGALGAAVAVAVRMLLEQDRQLLEVNAAERAISARLAVHLAKTFPEYHVDVEYNRMGDAPKEVAWNDKPERVYPDIIIHRRQTGTNVLAIEIKKTSNAEDKGEDLRKLQAYRRDLGYLHALFIRFGIGKQAGVISECEWA